MIKRKKKNKFKQYLKVFKRRLKSLTLKKVMLWLKANFKQHPFILGLLILFWINEVFSKDVFGKGSTTRLLKFHLLILILWLVLVVFSNLLKDKDKTKVKWYFRKRLVFFLLLLLPPLGLIFLWSGAQFKRITKIIFTIIFSSYFVVSQISYNKRYEKLLSKSQLERTIEMITSQKRQTFIKQINKDILSSLKLEEVPKKKKVKLAVSEISVRCLPGTVSIKTIDKYGKEIGMGSGFIISSDGIIVTNFHVLTSAYQAQIKIGDEVFKQAYLVKAVPNLDIAILKIEAKDLLALTIGNSDSLLSGQFITVFGNPWGFERSVSSGIVSAIRQKGTIKLIQMTAPVSPGSSGGPVINEYGEVIGITTIASFFFAQNLNFAIPINYLHKIIKGK
ncbi:MAG: S1C family serine protease [Candidatus Omnitrophota bacterium]|nr:S1C family serine protease [Candidatus Omnitrophota bacterium]